MKEIKWQRPPLSNFRTRGVPGSNFDELWFYDEIKDKISTIYDVGASDESNFINFNGDVHYFEPTSRLNKLRDIAKNKNSYFLNFGLSDIDSDVREVTWETGGAVPHPDRPVHYLNENNKTMKTTTGKTYMNNNGHQSIDFLKIDTEGHELAVLKGFGDRIKDINIIQFEYGGTSWASGVKMMDVVEHLKEYDFVRFSYCAAGGLQEIDIEDFEEHWHWCNVVCFHKSFLSKFEKKESLFYKISQKREKNET